MIVDMNKVLLVGQISQRKALIQKLQEIGVVHIEPVKMGDQSNLHELKEYLEKADKALAILKEISHSSVSTTDSKEDGPNVIDDILEIHSQILDFQEDLKDFHKKYEELAVWGDFSGDLLAQLQEKGVQIRLWKCPMDKIREFDADCVNVVNCVGKDTFLTTVNYDKEITIPKEAHEVFIQKGSKEIKAEIDVLNEKIKTSEDALKNYLGTVSEIKKYTISLKDSIAAEVVHASSLQHEDVFGVKGWIPVTCKEEFKEKLADFPVVLEICEATEEDTPPTLIQNPRWIQSILDVVRLYATPGFEEWDPSASVYFAFTVFFAMIVGDAGYGLFLFLLMQALRGKLQKSDAGSRVYRLMTTLSLGCVVFGAMMGSWFAIDSNLLPAFLKKFHILCTEGKATDPKNTSFMMNVAICAGVVHLTVARLVKFSMLIQVKNLKQKLTALAELGWMIVMWSGIAILIFKQPIAMNGLYAGLGIVFLFSGTSTNPLVRIMEGLLGLLGISQNFADVLSYLRLFALGLASAVMGGIFNNLGLQVKDSIPIVGYVLMVLIIFMGHTINLVLALMSGFIHGLRLNFLEFYRYCFEGTGYDYRPLIKTQK